MNVTLRYAAADVCIEWTRILSDTELMSLSRKALPLYILSVLSGGFVLYIARECSKEASWSLLISAVNGSPWELTKPFLLVFILWSFVEMACERPHLLHYVSVRILSMHLMLIVSLTLLSVIRHFGQSELWKMAGIFAAVTAGELATYFSYRSQRKTELFFVPILISFILLFFSLLFCTLYPLPLPFFAP